MNNIQFSPAKTSYNENGQEFSSPVCHALNEISNVLLTPGLELINGIVRVFIIKLKPGWWDQMNNVVCEVLYRLALTIVGLVALPFVILSTLIGYPLYLIAHTNKKDFVYHPAVHAQNDSKPKEITAQVFNTIAMPKFACTFNKITPCMTRIYDIARKLIEKNSDFILLQETFSSPASKVLDEALHKNGYSTVYNIGPNATGLNSGLFLASKHPLSNIHFYNHPSLQAGEDAFANKGFIIATAKVGSRTVVIANTHLNAGHTEKAPGFACRAIQVIGIYKRIDQYIKTMFAKGQVIDGVLLFGDMNVSPFAYHDNYRKDGLLIPEWQGQWLLANTLHPVLDTLDIPDYRQKNAWSSFVRKVDALHWKDLWARAYAKIDNKHITDKQAIEKYSQERRAGPFPTELYKHDMEGTDAYEKSCQGTVVDRDFSPHIFRGTDIVTRPDRTDYALVRRKCTLDEVIVEEPGLSVDLMPVLDDQGRLLSDHIGLDVKFHFT